MINNCLVIQLKNIKPNIDSASDVDYLYYEKLINVLSQLSWLMVIPIAIYILLDPRYKNLHFHGANVCSKARSVLRKMLNNDLGNITSTDTLRECNESPTMETYNFWNHHKSH